ncbi:hypothetical protein R1sor_008684 [Riccia sorocarpa]|uniref:Uncharacterized protein n=1 Tax=Riccia sorocarpa TaxID=122646 RepID=A0ABD3HUI4_9MARC
MFLKSTLKLAAPGLLQVFLSSSGLKLPADPVVDFFGASAVPVVASLEPPVVGCCWLHGSFGASLEPPRFSFFGVQPFTSSLPSFFDPSPLVEVPAAPDCDGLVSVLGKINTVLMAQFQKLPHAALALLLEQKLKSEATYSLRVLVVGSNIVGDVLNSAFTLWKKIIVFPRRHGQDSPLDLLILEHFKPNLKASIIGPGEADDTEIFGLRLLPSLAFVSTFHPFMGELSREDYARA